MTTETIPNPCGTPGCVTEYENGRAVAGSICEHHPALTRWEPCTVCRNVCEPQKMVAAGDVIPGRKRGWICESCAARLNSFPGANGE